MRPGGERSAGPCPSRSAVPWCPRSCRAEWLRDRIPRRWISGARRSRRALRPKLRARSGLRPWRRFAAKDKAGGWALIRVPDTARLCHTRTRVLPDARGRPATGWPCRRRRWWHRLLPARHRHPGSPRRTRNGGFQAFNEDYSRAGSRPAQVLVPLQISGRRTDARDIRAPVAVQVRDGAGCGRDAVVQHHLCPLDAFGILRVVDVHAFAAITGDHFVGAIAVQIGGENRVAIGERIVDDLARPRAGAFLVDRHLIAVPRLDGGQITPLTQLAHGPVAGPGFGPRRGVALGDLGAAPTPVPAKFVQMNAGEAGGQDFVAAVAIPVHDVDAVDHALIPIRNGLALPFAWPVEHQRRVRVVLGVLDIGGGQRLVDHYLLAAAVDIGPPQAVGSGQPVDLPDAPRLARISIVPEHGYDASAVFGILGKAGGQHDFGNAVAVHIPGGQIDHAGKVASDDMALPTGILEPYQLRHAAGERDQVDLAIVVHVDRHYLVAACQAGGDGMFCEVRGGRGGERSAKENPRDGPHAPSIEYRGHRRRRSSASGAFDIFLPIKANFG